MDNEQHCLIVTDFPFLKLLVDINKVSDVIRHLEKRQAFQI